MKVCKKYTFLILLIILVKIGGTQNLVPNPSFESYTSCPTDHGQLDLASPWVSPTTGTSDYFNSCIGTGCGHNFPWVCVPKNWLGTQMPHSGNAYAGFFIRWSSSSFYREYLQTQLITPMVAGQYYEVALHVSLSEQSEYASNNIEIYFSDTAITRNDSLLITCCSPQLEPDVYPIKDKSGWTRMSMCYQATGDEEYMTIGNFKHPNNVVVLGVHTPTFFNNYNCYYYIDDVSIIPFNGDCDTVVKFTMPNVFSPNGDGLNDYFNHKQLENIDIRAITIYNRWGQVLFKTEDLLEGWDGTFEGENCPSGTYYWLASYVDFREGTKTLKGFVTLLR